MTTSAGVGEPEEVSTGKSWCARPLLLLFMFFAALLFCAAKSGPDCAVHVNWGRAFAKAEIFHVQSETGSPLGVPVTQWPHGAGLLFAFTEFISTRLPGPLGDFRLAGWLAALVLWWSLYHILRHVTNADNRLVLFGLGAAFAGTHLGLYSVAHGSESLSLACLALMAYWVIVPRQWRALDVLTVAALGAMLVTIRLLLALYVLLALGVMAYRVFKDGDKSPGRCLLYGALAAIPPGLALAQIAFVNRWMTGSVFGLPCVFGGSEFRSIDLLRPEFLAVLFHPWHGLLVYHPLYGICFAFLLWNMLSSTSSAERWLYVGAFLVIGVHLYLQAAWYCWWLGNGSFGMRGMGVCAVVFIPVMAHAIKRRLDAGQSVAGMFLAIVASCVWSFVLMLQEDSNYFTFQELFHAQWIVAINPGIGVPLLWFGVLAVMFSWDVRVKADWWHMFGGVLLVAFSSFYLCSQVIVVRGEPSSARWLAYILWFCALGGVVAFLYREAISRGDAAMSLESKAARFLAPAVLLVFVGANVLFGRMAVVTEGQISQGPRTLAFDYRGTVDVGEVRKCYDEYLQIPGFDEKKAALQVFLKEEEKGN